MSQIVKNLTLLGSTGSIGQSTVDVVRAQPARHRIVALSAYTQLDRALAQAIEFRPQFLVAADERAAANFDWSSLPPETTLLAGADGLVEIASNPEVDIVVAAIVGSAGLRGTWAALEAGKTCCVGQQRDACYGWSVGDGLGPSAWWAIIAGR